MTKKHSGNHFVNFTDLGFDISNTIPDSKYDPALMNFDNEQETSVDDGGLPRPTVIQMGVRAWSSGVANVCPVCGGHGPLLNNGPKNDRYCGYCDRYGLDTSSMRAELSIRNLDNAYLLKKKRRMNKKNGT